MESLENLILDGVLSETIEPGDPPRVVVRIRTSCWSDRRGLHMKRDITYLKKLSSGFNFFDEDVGCVGATDMFSQIVNLNELDDGIYEVVPCNFSTDFETGVVDDYEYTLVPYQE